MTSSSNCNTNWSDTRTNHAMVLWRSENQRGLNHKVVCINQPKEVNKFLGFRRPEDESKIKAASILWRPKERRKDHDGSRDSGEKFPERYASHLHIEYLSPTISTALMWKWHLNSNFTASNLFYHLQQSFDGRSILRNVLKRASGGLRCKDEGYKRKNLPEKWGFLRNLREREK